MTTQNRHLNFKLILAYKAMNSLFSNLKLEARKNAPQHWVDLIEAINKGEPDLFRKLKSAEKIASMYGCYYAQFELWRDEIKINFAVPSSLRNNYLRLAQGEAFNAVVEMLWYKAKGSKLVTIESYTDYDVNRVVMQTGTTGLINNDIFVIKAPDYILAHNKTGLYTHDYGVLPVYQFLNKDDMDYVEGELSLADWYPARDMLLQLNDFWFNYVADEMSLDTTRIIGTVSYQELFGKSSEAEELELFIKNKNAYMDSDYYKSKTGSYTAKEKLMKKLIIHTPGDVNKVEKMQSTFNGDGHITTFQKWLSNAFEICGYSWKSGDDIGGYENTAAVLRVNKTEYDTTKDKKILREKDWYIFLQRIATAYFKKTKGMSLEQAQKEAKDIEKYILFEIISGMLSDYLNGDERVIDLYQAGLMSRDRAVQATNPDLTDDQLKEEISKLEEKEQEQQNMLNDAMSSNWEYKDTNQPKKTPQEASK